MDATAAATTDTPEEQAREKKQARERLKILAAMRQWWRKTMVQTVDQVDVIRRTKEETGLVGRYIFMTSMSAGIAIIGLILPSPAVVIGAMLLSPLMGPIIGAGFALAIWDVKWLREAGRSLFIGILASILLSAFITWISPIQSVTEEIASRTRPSLLDLGVALFSALAGAYAMIRGRAGTIVGVAIAVALMPPLAVVGFGLATWNWAVFGGSLLLFITNLVTIAVASAAMARLYGFKTTLSKKRGRLQSLAMALVLIVLAIPLYFSLSQIAWESRATRIADEAVRAAADPRARIQSLNLDFDSKPMRLDATVLTPSRIDNAESLIRNALAISLERPVDVQVDQIEGNFDANDAQIAELSAARNREVAAANERRTDALVDRLALVAGVPDDDVIVDRDNRRLIVRGAPLDGAQLRAYRDLEDRVRATSNDWAITLIPPAVALAPVTFDAQGEPDADSVSLLVWAMQRIDAPVILIGPAPSIAAIRENLPVALGPRIIARPTAIVGEAGTAVIARWAAPDAI